MATKYSEIATRENPADRERHTYDVGADYLVTLMRNPKTDPTLLRQIAVAAIFGTRDWGNDNPEVSDLLLKVGVLCPWCGEVHVRPSCDAKFSDANTEGWAQLP